MGSAIFVLRDPKLQLNQHLVLLQNIMVDMVANTLGLRLPEELLLLVFQHLDPPTLLAVRQTCRFVGKSISVEYFHLFLWNISILSQSLPLCVKDIQFLSQSLGPASPEFCVTLEIPSSAPLWISSQPLYTAKTPTLQGVI